MSDPLKIPPESDRLSAVAKQFGTPTYAYIESIIRRQCKRLRKLVGDLPARLLYAMKANDNPALLQIIRDEGLGLDVVSPAELELALRLGFDPDDVLFSSAGMTDAEMERAVSRGVLPNLGALSRLEAFGAAYPGEAVCVRLNPMIGTGHHEHVVTAGKTAKFGIPVDQFDEVRRIVDTHDLALVGLHQHIGSGIHNLDAYGTALDVLIDTAHTVDGLRFINVGGGLNTPHRPEDLEMQEETFAEHVVQPLRSFADDYSGNLTVRFEPGRFLVAEAGVLLTEVTTLKSVGERTIAITDSGMNHLIRPPLYGAYHAAYNLSNPDGSLQTYDIVGNICESGDVVARGRAVQTLRPGDVLAILDAGAYGMTMASTYNLRPLPAEVLIRANGTLREIRPRRLHEDLAEARLREASIATAQPDAP